MDSNLEPETNCACFVMNAGPRLMSIEDPSEAKMEAVADFVVAADGIEDIKVSFGTKSSVWNGQCLVPIVLLCVRMRERLIDSSRKPVRIHMELANMWLDGDNDRNILASILSTTGVVSVTELRFNGCTIRNPFVKEIANILAENRTIERLELVRCAIDDESAKMLAKILKDNNHVLKILDLSLNHFGCEGANSIVSAAEKSSELVTLNFGGINIGLEGATAIAKVLSNSGKHSLSSSLRTLNLANCNLHDEGIKAIADAFRKNQFRNLRELIISHNLIGRKGIAAIANLLVSDSHSRNNAASHRLISLKLSGCEIGDAGAVSIAEALTTSTLRKLELGCNGIGPKGAIALANALANRNCCWITKLNLTNNKLEDEGAKAIGEALTAHNRVLRKLYVGTCEIGIKGQNTIAEAVAENPVIEKLDVSNNDQDIVLAANMTNRTFINAMMKNQTLKSLNLSYNLLYGIGAELLIGSSTPTLTVKSALRRLTLGSCNISGKDAKIILTVLAERHYGLEILDLRTNHVLDSDAESVVKILLENKNIAIQELNLEDNSINDEKAKIIAKSLVHNTGLKKLGLSRNEIADEGAKALADALLQNHTLSILILVSNSIEDEGAKAFAECLAKNHGVEEIYLSRNNIRDEGAKALAAMLSRNSTLTQLGLEVDNLLWKTTESLSTDRRIHI